MTKPVLFIDIDGVMADSITWWIELYNRDHGTNHKKEDVTGWDTRECIKADLSPYFSNYDGVESVVGAKHSVHILRHYYRIVFATVGNGSEWLRRFIPNAEIVQIHDKSLLRGFALIDDRPLNLDGFIGERYLLSQPWNRGRNLNDATWEEITAHLVSI